MKTLLGKIEMKIFHFNQNGFCHGTFKTCKYYQNQSRSPLYEVQKNRIPMYLYIVTFLGRNRKISLYIYRRFPVEFRRSKLYSNRTWAFAFFNVVAFAYVLPGPFTEYNDRFGNLRIVNGIFIQRKLFIEICISLT